ncbi:hypothetical protein AJ79_04018 [Helicocarpus griseus UAMH5409]|uniref:FAD-binding PCMH-type domain-containing protein n=1 Tax=Helicocarpus griseus UAMH5409 TaxID=1447875 RepID=A0A2B7XM10_9EURO|nr:hypothetical protein AJ79_04018 [Helicocarpus griseus UAMH5409]
MRFLATTALIAIVGTAHALVHGSFQCCIALSQAGLGVTYPGEPAYEASVGSHWSIAARIRPTCILQPETTQDVSLAVSTLVKPTSSMPCQFAVRSGGHITWAGAASIQDGVTIDLSLMSAVTYNKAVDTVSIGPGARWGQVYDTLDKIGVSVAGCRAASVGVGGLILSAGGNSFYAGRIGFVCDNVAQFEVVLADGDIVIASPEINSDLFKALKGGSNNFGIVTKFDMYTIGGDGKLWGGVVTYPPSTSAKQISAFVNFVDNIENDPYASAIPIWYYNSTLGQTIVLNAFDYTKPVVAPPAFEEYLAIPGNTSDSLRIADMTNLSEELEQTPGFRDVFSTVTFVNDGQVLHKMLELRDYTISYLTDVSSKWAMSNIIQPIPTIFAKNGVERGGNVLGLDRATENLVLLQTFLAWDDKAEDKIFRKAGTELTNKLSAYAKSLGKDNEYLYLAYALDNQDPLKSYGPENVQHMKNVAQKYDPLGIFQTMVPGGFKITKVV